ncbi:MAG: WD40 repeat domain-containing protein [Saprospiraceae bacterium]|nr:WD40 repeat domain-containing protein [Saprospiraceae bacterium]
MSEINYKSTTFILMLLLASMASTAQVHYPDASLRLFPVWSRVADVYGELGSIESAEFSPDGRHIVSGSKFDNSIIMWRTSDGAEVWRKYAEQEVERVGWSSDSRYVASCSEDYLVQVWDSKSGNLVKDLKHDQGIDGLSWSNTGLLLVTGEEAREVDVSGAKSKKAKVRIFEFPEGEQIDEIEVEGTVNEIMFSKDDKYFLAAGHNFVKVFSTNGFKLVQELVPDEFFKFTTADFTPDAKHIAASGFGGLIYVWDWQEGKLIKRFNYRGRKVESLCWHPNGDYLVTSGHGPYINIFRKSEILQAPKEVQAAAQVFANDGAEYIDFNQDGGYLVSAHQDGIIRLWVWKGEDHMLNEQRHRWVSEQQKEANKVR